MGNAGAVLRLLLGVGALLPEVRYTTDHPSSLGERPNGDLLTALRSLGIATEAREPGGRLPITLRGGPPIGGDVAVSGARSSQYLSALLYLAPLLSRGLTISVPDELRSAPLVQATLRALWMAGIVVEASGNLRRFVAPGGQTFQAREYVIPGDGPSAAALLAIAVALRTPLRLDRLETEAPDVRATLDAFTALGIALTISDTESDVVTVAGEQRTRDAVIDGDACIDSVPALVALACLGEGTTRFENVATLRLKESDRIGDLCAELRRAGCAIEPGADSITTHGRPGGIAGGAVVSAHEDHRLAQALAIVALGSERGLTITGANTVAKSYPGFFDDLATLGAEVRAL
jgi:3-phosphoshikimate 1-carboxyvinyltransferase